MEETTTNGKNADVLPPGSSKKFYKLFTKMNEKHSPCKVKFVPFVVFGYKVASYECATDEEQLNKFSNLECVTIKRNRLIKILNKNKKLKYIKRDIGIGCELRFEPKQNYLNKLSLV